MNPEDLDLPQPPEGILDPQIPWSYVRPQSPLWNTLKARLTGRPTNGEHYSSYVNLTEADADKLIENLKKDPRGYPSLDQTSGNPVQWMERQKKYQEWLVEEYLEKPFRKKVDAKIEQSEIDRLVNQRRDSKIKPTTPLIPSSKPPAPDPEPAPDLIPDIPEEPKVELIPEIPEPVVAQPEPEKPKPAPLRDEDLTVPNMMPSNVMRAMTKYGSVLDKVGNELSKQNFRLERSLGYLRRIDEDLDDAKFLLEQMSENYQDALDDFESEERKKEARKKFFQKLSSPFVSKKQSPQTKLAEGGISTSPSAGKVIAPGIYDNPTTGVLAPGTAVVPLNRNYGKQILNQYDNQQFIQSFAEVLGKSTNALLGAAVSVFGSTLKSLGVLSGYFNSGIAKNIDNLSTILNLSRSEIIEMLGGEGVSGVKENFKDLKHFYKSWRVYMDYHGLFFPGAGGPFGGPPPKGKIAENILIIGPNGEGLMGKGGPNVNQPPAWIPFSKDSAGKLFYISGFGMRWGKPHTGIDLAGDRGIEIITPFAGKVYDINRGAAEGDRRARGGYGNLVGIEHTTPPVKTFYGHLQQVAEHLQVGSSVQAGEVIGTLGNTGFSTGPHLHWEVIVGGAKVDPVPWTHENKPSFSEGGFLNILGRVLPGTGTVMAPKSGGPKDIQGVRQTQAAYQNKFLGMNIGNPFLPRGRMGEYSQKENRRYYEKTGKYFIPTDFGPGYLPGIHGLYTPPNTKQQVTPQGAITSTNNQQLRNAIQNARDITNMPGGGAYKPLVESAAGTAIKQQKYYDTLRETMRDAGMRGADENMDIYGNLKNKPKPKTISMNMPSSSSPRPVIQQASKSQLAFIEIEIPTDVIITSTQMRRMA